MRNNVRHSCAFCEGEFASKYLEDHLRAHIQERPYSCKTCKKMFTSDAILKFHMVTHLGDAARTHLCPLCPKSFKTKASLRGHILVHTGEKTFKCKTCSKSFPKKSDLNRHETIHTERIRIKCHLCHLSFLSRNSLAYHLRGHSESIVKSHKCTLCEKSYVEARFLKEHMLSHSEERNFECSKCTKRFKSALRLRVHQAVHSENKIYSCAECSATFNIKSYLHKHMKIHQGDNIKCSHCPKTFQRRAYYRNHLRRWHPTNEAQSKRHTCLFCEERFHKLNHLKEHMSLHTKEKPYSCEICGIEFTQCIARSVHITAVHTNERSYSCHICNARFSTSRNLRSHKLTHILTSNRERTQSNNINCSSCPMTFTTKSGYRAYFKNVHVFEGNVPRPFQCIFCPKSFITSVSLENHLRAHVQEKPYFCELCDRELSTVGVKNNHIQRIHTYEKPHICKICGRGFTVLYDLRRHLLVHHS